MAGRSHVSITDIARAAGVSIATVSRILNNKAGDIPISEQTRTRVMDVAEELGYRPNPFASALRTNRTGIIGALNPNFSGTYMALLTKHLVVEAKRQGVELLVGAPEVNESQIEVQLNKLQNLLFDGLLLLGDMLGYQSIIRRMHAVQKPYVTVSAGTLLPPPYVNIDEVKAFRSAVGYLKSLGHDRIAYLSSPQWTVGVRKIELFREVMFECGLPVRDEYISSMEGLSYTPMDLDFVKRSSDYPMAYAQALMRLPEPPTAILGSNDGFAIAAIKGITEMGLSVPDDVSIMGFGDEITADLFVPGLTTVRHPLETIAAHAISLLLHLIEEPDDGHESRILVDPELVVRGSCAPF